MGRKLFASLCILLFSTSGALAGNWHIAGSLKCGDCHLQHASSQLEPPTGAFSYMLKKNSVNELCLSCHDGSDPTAPDVSQPITMYSSTSSMESAAGHFDILGSDSPFGHTLGLPTITPLQDVGTSAELNCASCHAVHGNDNYRNLSHDPALTGAYIQVAEDIDIMTLQKPAIPPSAGVSSIAYEQENSAYITAQLSAWCVSCHDILSTNAVGTLPAHFSGHPSNVALNENSFEPHADAAHWTGGIGEGFTPGLGDGISRVPYLATQANSYVTAKIPQATNQVACVSCHKSHGSNHQRGMLWPYLEGGTGYMAGCQQCHNK